MKILFLTFYDMGSPTAIGASKKVYGQLKAFLSKKLYIDFIYNRNNKIFAVNLNKKIKNELICITKQDKYYAILEQIYNNRYDLIYIRYSLSDFHFINFLDKVKLNIPNIKLVLEFPTYPYDKELIEAPKQLFFDKYFRKFLHQYIDFCICFNQYSYIYNIPSIYIGNGIDLQDINLISNDFRKNKSIHLIGVATLYPWHGYERVIEGLKNYYNKDEKDIDIFFDIVGKGKEFDYLFNLTKKYGLQNKVIFHGWKQGEDLEKIYSYCDVAVGSLGMYKINMIDGSTLKVREYCARGIPFILGYDDLDFTENFSYIMKVSNDKTPLNMYDIIDFYYENLNVVQLRHIMRTYAENNLTWESKINKVLEKVL